MSRSRGYLPVKTSVHLLVFFRTASASVARYRSFIRMMDIGFASSIDYKGRSASFSETSSIFITAVGFSLKSGLVVGYGLAVADDNSTTNRVFAYYFASSGSS